MNSATAKHSPLSRPLAIWSVLVAATGLTYAAGEFGTPGRLLMVAVLAIALVKGALVSLDFMELRHAPPLWRRIVIGWLLVVSAGIIFAYLKGTP